MQRLFIKELAKTLDASILEKTEKEMSQGPIKQERIKRVKLRVIQLILHALKSDSVARVISIYRQGIPGPILDELKKYANIVTCPTGTRLYGYAFGILRDLMNTVYSYDHKISIDAYATISSTDGTALDPSLHSILSEMMRNARTRAGSFFEAARSLANLEPSKEDFVVPNELISQAISRDYDLLTDTILPVFGYVGNSIDATGASVHANSSRNENILNFPGSHIFSNQYTSGTLVSKYMTELYNLLYKKFPYAAGSEESIKELLLAEVVASLFICKAIYLHCKFHDVLTFLPTGYNRTTWPDAYSTFMPKALKAETRISLRTGIVLDSIAALPVSSISIIRQAEATQIMEILKTDVLCSIHDFVYKQFRKIKDPDYGTYGNLPAGLVSLEIGISQTVPSVEVMVSDLRKKLNSIRLDLFSDTFLVRVRNLWNKLPHDFFRERNPSCLAPTVTVPAHELSVSETTMLGVEIEFFYPRKYVLVTDGIINKEHSENIIFVRTPLGTNLTHDGSIHIDEDLRDEYKSNELRFCFSLSNRKTLDAVCAFLQRIEAKVNKSCGLHIHIDCLDDSTLKNKVARNLYRALPLLLVTQPLHRRANRFCPPNFVYTRDSYGGGRYQAINVNSFNRHGSVEVRLSEASIDKDYIFNWAKLLVGISNLKENSESLLWPVWLSEETCESYNYGYFDIGESYRASNLSPLCIDTTIFGETNKSPEASILRALLWRAYKFHLLKEGRTEGGNESSFYTKEEKDPKGTSISYASWYKLIKKRKLESFIPSLITSSIKRSARDFPEYGSYLRFAQLIGPKQKQYMQPSEICSILPLDAGRWVLALRILEENSLMPSGITEWVTTRIIQIGEIDADKLLKYLEDNASIKDLLLAPTGNPVMDKMLFDSNMIIKKDDFIIDKSPFDEDDVSEVPDSATIDVADSSFIESVPPAEPTFLTPEDSPSRNLARPSIEQVINVHRPVPMNESDSIRVTGQAHMPRRCPGAPQQVFDVSGLNPAPSIIDELQRIRGNFEDTSIPPPIPGNSIAPLSQPNGVAVTSRHVFAVDSAPLNTQRPSFSILHDEIEPLLFDTPSEAQAHQEATNQ